MSDIKEKNLIGKNFGQWTVVDKAETRINSSGRNMRYWICECNCPKRTRKEVLERSLINGVSTSCGCSRSNTMKERKRNMTHGMSNSRLYRIYKHMYNRCYNQNDIRYENYGARGITVCEEWHNFENFMKWAFENGYSDTLSIDRIDVNKGYLPSNCRWCNNKEQSNNRTTNKRYTYLNETHTISEWANLYNINYKKLWKRLHNGWSIENALLK